MSKPTPQDLRVRIAVERYCAQQRNPLLPSFKTHDLQSWTDWGGTPQAAKPGCYVVYNAIGEIIYIGCSTHKRVGDRLFVHQRRAKWKTLAAAVQIIEVVEAFEAPSLEAYLLTQFETLANKNGCRSQ